VFAGIIICEDATRKQEKKYGASARQNVFVAFSKMHCGNIATETELYESLVQSAKKRLKTVNSASRFANRFLVAILTTLIVHTVLKIWSLKRLYPVAFSWYLKTFGVFYPLSRSVCKKSPGESFRTLWDVADEITYSNMQSLLSMMTVEKTISRQRAIFLYLCAHHFGDPSNGTVLTADMWDYSKVHMGEKSPWYTAFRSELLPLPSTDDSGKAMEPVDAENWMWDKWQNSKAKNPFYTCFPTNKRDFFTLEVVRQYAFQRRGEMTCDLEYLYFGGLCYVAQMCSTASEPGRQLFDRFFEGKFVPATSCGARIANSAIQTGSTTMGASLMCIPMDANPYAAAAAMVSSFVVGALGGVFIQKAKCKFEKDELLGKMMP
jgi:hypothetical protein